MKLQNYSPSVKHIQLQAFSPAKFNTISSAAKNNLNSKIRFSPKHSLCLDETNGTFYPKSPINSPSNSKLNKTNPVKSASKLSKRNVTSNEPKLMKLSGLKESSETIITNIQPNNFKVPSELKKRTPLFLSKSK